MVANVEEPNASAKDMVCLAMRSARTFLGGVVKREPHTHVFQLEANPNSFLQDVERRISESRCAVGWPKRENRITSTRFEVTDTQK